MKSPFRNIPAIIHFRIKMRLFAVCAPGLEPFTSQEIGQLGLSAHHPGNDSTCEIGGLEFEGNLIDLYRCNLHLRTASRVLVRLGSFYAAGFPELRRKAGNLPWEQYLKPGQPVAIRVTCHQSRLYHQRAVAERIVGSISDRLKQPVQVHKYHEEPETNSSIDNPPSPPFSKRLCRKLVHGSTSLPRKDIDTLNLNYLAVRPERVEGRTANYDTVFKGGTGGSLIVVRMVKDLCTISIDSSGELLHRRGYRLALTKAPLRETLAAAMILASGWDRTSPLMDPFCGSGTIPIEAALMARQIPPGWRRNFDFMNWPNFEKKTWDTLLQGSVP
ncbi:MAG TPA: hypothetical protein VLK23_13150, partial [Thermodesulfobacteriota bacterium]|nr:hypothetical protein [Thermodesulfobacteriota bacterium]